MQSVQSKIWAELKSGKEGRIVFPADFDAFGSDDAVRKSLSRLVQEQNLVRLAQGIYLYPKHDPDLGIIYPSIETVAEAIAKRDKARIIPTGVQALNKLGFSTQVPLKAVYLTDGTPRIIKVGNRSISFQKTSPKLLAIKDKLLATIITALQELGSENISKENLYQLRKVINHYDKDLIIKELDMAPVWIKKMIKSVLGEAAV